MLKEVKKELHRLEGVAEGIQVFHPRIGHFITQRVNAIQRCLYISEDTPDLRKLSGNSKPGFEFVDQEVAANPQDFELAEDGDYPVRKKAKRELRGKIEDRKVMEAIHG